MSLPAIITDWETWQTRHPSTTVAVLSRTDVRYRSTLHQQADTLLIGLANAEAARGWPFIELRQQRVVNDQFAGRPVLVSYRDGVTAVIFDRRLDGQTLSFAEEAGALIDAQTGTFWDAVTGAAISGPLAPRRLTLLPGIVSVNHAWASFYPESSYWRFAREQAAEPHQ